MNVSTSRMLRACAMACTMLVASAVQGRLATAQLLTEQVNRGLVEVITGRSDGTAIRMVENLADILNDSGTRRILPVLGQGSVQNIVDVKALRGVDIALVQLDALDQARQRFYPGVEPSLTYIAKLHDEEFHLLARSDIET